MACSIVIAQPSETYLKAFDPNPQNMYLFDHSNNIWSIDNYVYVTNLVGDVAGNRVVQILKIDANTQEIVKRIDMQGPQIDIACSGRGVTA